MGDQDSLEHVNWSASASQLFHTCQRKFYYRYTPGPDRESGQPYVPPPGVYLGIVVHDCLADQIGRWARNEHLHYQSARDQARAEINEYVETHEETIAERFDDSEGPFDTEAFAQSLIQTARDHIQRFFQVLWPRFERHRYIAHESRQSFEIEGEPVTVQPDLCSRSSDGEFVVTDWKTSPYDAFGNPTIQMQAYALYAHEAYEPDLERIRIQLAHTRSGEFDRLIPEKETIKRVRERITADRTVWRNEGDVETYEPQPEAEKCARCPYVGRCKAGQEIIGED